MRLIETNLEPSETSKTFFGVKAHDCITAVLHINNFEKETYKVVNTNNKVVFTSMTKSINVLLKTVDI